MATKTLAFHTPLIGGPDDGGIPALPPWFPVDMFGLFAFLAAGTAPRAQFEGHYDVGTHCICFLATVVCIFISAACTCPWVSMFLPRRVPSECWPIHVSSDGDCLYGPAQRTQSVIHAFSDSVVLCLKRRKNRPQGSKLVRTCWCDRCPVTCPVHVLGAYYRFACTHLHACVLPLLLRAARFLTMPCPLQAFAAGLAHEPSGGHLPNTFCIWSVTAGLCWRELVSTIQYHTAHTV